MSNAVRTPARVTQDRFRAMASGVHVILVDPRPGAGAYVRRRLAEIERHWSRFLPDSDISRINAASGALVLVAADTIRLVSAMTTGCIITGGGYDPTLLQAVVRAGYSRSIDGGAVGGSATGCGESPSVGLTSGAPHEGSGRQGGGMRGTGSRRGCLQQNRYRRYDRRSDVPSTVLVSGISVDPRTGAITLPPGVELDPGGIGKGLAADIVVTELLASGTSGALVGIGGDLAAAGTPPSPAGWQVGVEEPDDTGEAIADFCLNAGGVATSSTVSRTWVQDGRRRHHAIDPITGTCSTTDLATASVVARSGWEAEVHATAALLAGGAYVLGYLAAHRLSGVAVTLDGEILLTPDFAGADSEGPSGSAHSVDSSERRHA